MGTDSGVCLALGPIYLIGFFNLTQSVESLSFGLTARNFDNFMVLITCQNRNISEKNRLKKISLIFFLYFFGQPLK